jgi:hypothetical protein
VKQLTNVSKVITAAANDYTTIVMPIMETMINPDGSPNTALQPVPIILVDKELKKFTMGF